MKIEDVYDAHVEKVYRFFYIQCLDATTTEDLTSQTFMMLCEQMQNPDKLIRDHKKFLYGIMRNIWLMHLRKKYQRHETPLEGLEEFEDYVDAEIEVYESLTVKQRAEIVINRLPEKQREVVAQRLLQERSIRDIAVALGKDTNYVKTTYKRGLKRLKQLIQEGNVALATQEVL